MKFTREELSLIQTALHFYVRDQATPKYGRAGDQARDLKNRIQSHLLADECPITVRSPPSVPA
jgi:hypothetical protein